MNPLLIIFILATAALAMNSLPLCFIALAFAVLEWGLAIEKEKKR